MTTCTAAVIQAYFTNGTLPAPGTVCQPDFGIFDADPDDVVDIYYFDIPSQSAVPTAPRDLHEAAKTMRRSNFMLRNSPMGQLPALRQYSSLLL
jgi:hypothetical protein